jgi:uncharacterized protein with HEPN domain
MAKTLKEFLGDRAEGDVRALNLAFASMPTTKSAQQNLDKALYDKDRQILLPCLYVHEAAMVFLNQTGEAIQKVQEEDPELLRQLPSFPWQSLIRLRHAMTHIGSHTIKLKPEAFKSKMKSTRKEFEAILENWPAPASEAAYKNPHYRHAMMSLKYFLFFKEIAEGFALDENIPLTQSARVENILWNYTENEREDGVYDKVMKWNIPLNVVINSIRFRINMTIDALDSGSGLLKLKRPEIYSSPMIAEVRHARNHLAHFEDRLTTDDNHTRTDIQQLALALRSMDDLAKKHPQHGPDASVASETKKLVDEYTHLILGASKHNAQKMTEIDGFTEWVTKNFNGKQRLQEAAIYAAGQIVQLPITQAQEILAYIKNNKTALMNPDSLLTSLNGQSNVLQIGVRDFVSNMKEVLSVENKRGTVASFGRNT